MKSKLLIMAALCAIAFTANAQTKGTNALSFGVSTYTTSNSNSVSENEYEAKQNSFTLGYGHFFQDNSKVGLELSYGLSKYNYFNNPSQELKNYGVILSYQKYYPIVKTLFAYAGGKGGYTMGKESRINTNIEKNDFNAYSVGAYGGLTWFVSKRFAFETNLLAANASYTIQKRVEASGQNTFESKSTSFNLTSQGFINDLGFKIYLLF